MQFSDPRFYCFPILSKSGNLLSITISLRRVFDESILLLFTFGPELLCKNVSKRILENDAYGFLISFMHTFLLCILEQKTNKIVVYL